MPKPIALKPETIREIIALADDMTGLFAPPEYIPGCLVNSVADKDEYATDNGWIEAVCGKHNQQRCRWRGQYSGVAVNDYVDVIYFKSFKLFVVLNKGGTGSASFLPITTKGDLLTYSTALARLGVGADDTVLTADSTEATGLKWAVAGGNVWPLAGEANIDGTSYATLELMLAALAGNDQGLIGEGSYTSSWGTGGGRIPTTSDVKGSGMNVSVIANTAGVGVTLEVEGDSSVEDLSVTNNVAGGTGFFVDDGGDAWIKRVKSTVAATGAIEGFYFYSNASTCNGILLDCEADVSGATNNYAIYALSNAGAGCTVLVEDGYYDGDVVADGTGAAITLDGPVITGSVTKANSGVITGHYYDADGNHIVLDRVTQTAWQDYQLVGDNNADGVTSHFRDNDSSYPAGWTETDAAHGVDTNDLYSFFHIVGSSTNTTWDYNIQSSVNIEGNTETKAMFGPILFRQLSYSADVNYYFGLYRNNAGSIDTATYGRARIRYDQSAGLWKIQGQESDGSTPHTGTEYSLDNVPVHLPLFVFVDILTSTKAVAVEFGTTPVNNTGFRLLAQLPTSAPTWGDVWVRMHQSRGAGSQDMLWVGAVDFITNG